MCYIKREWDIFNIDKDNLLQINNKYQNGAYGVAYSLLKYINEDVEKTCITCPIEHGLSISARFVTAKEHTNCSNYIITNSSYNESNINRISDKKVIKIGPYIQYAKSCYSSKSLIELKKKLGKTLLVFPTHGIEGYKPIFCMNSFMEEIERVRESFDTVMVCIYFYDVLCDYHEQYLKKGYTVVSAGNEANKFFLEKLKTIFMLSDAVISNSYTTGLQYAIHMRKPVYVVKDLELEFRQDKNGFNNVDKLDESLIERDRLEEFYSMCNDPCFRNMSAQLEWGEYMFGFDQIKNKKEMKEVLKPVIRHF